MASFRRRLDSSGRMARVLSSLDLDDRKELRASSSQMGKREVSFLIDALAEVRKARIKTGNKAKSFYDPSDYPVGLYFIEKKLLDTEASIVMMLTSWVESQPAGRWIMSIPGIGPTIAAPLVALINTKKCPTISSAWKLCGLEPSPNGEPTGERISASPHLRQAIFNLCFRLSVGVKRTPDLVYCKAIIDRNKYESEKNDRFEYKEQAAAFLARGGAPTRMQTKEWSSGRLTRQQIKARSERWAAKLFISHFWSVLYEIENGKPAPPPYSQRDNPEFSLVIPNWPMEEMND